MTNIYKLPLVIDPQPEGGYTITCPVLPELITEADNLPEIYANVADALVAIIEAYQDLGRPLPEVLKPLQSSSTIWAETLIPLAA
jgi:antitoxin HicB